MNVSSILEQLVEIPAGQVELRDDRTKQKWTAVVKPFWLGKYPVTQELYFDVTQEAPSLFKGRNHPVENVTWEDAVLFCNALSQMAGLQPCYALNATTEEIQVNVTANGYRLPTEAEWEYACKAGTAGARYGLLEDVAWFKGNSGRSTQPVGQKSPNAWGLYDMLGNVWEWCSDIYDQTTYGSYRIFRGGGWCDEERSVMATTRRRSHPSKFKIDDLGFRIARNQIN